MNSKDAFVLFVNQNPNYSYLDVWNAGEKFGANKQQSHKTFSSVVDENKLNYAMYDDDAFIKDIQNIAAKVGLKTDINILYIFSHELMKLRAARIFEACYLDSAQDNKPVG